MDGHTDDGAVDGWMEVCPLRDQTDEWTDTRTACAPPTPGGLWAPLSVRPSPPPGAGRMIWPCSLIQRDPISAGLRRKTRNHPALPYISHQPQPPSAGGTHPAPQSPPPPSPKYISPELHLCMLIPVPIPPAPRGTHGSCHHELLQRCLSFPLSPQTRGWDGCRSGARGWIRAGGRNRPPDPPPAALPTSWGWISP